MKAPLNKTLLMGLMCLCLFGCSKPEAPTTGEQKAPAKELVKAPPGPVKGESFSIPDINLDMLWCKPGTFLMGSPEDEKDRKSNETQHEVTLTKGFWLGKYEVTQEQWEKVMENNLSSYNGPSRPVERVSWKDVTEFCEKLTQVEKAEGRLPEGWIYTLPTEAQWEYACRAGTTTAYSFGDEITPKQANFTSESGMTSLNVGKTTPMGTYPANPWGFHDMHGNVWEWCSDWYGDYPSGSVSDPVGPSDGTVRVSRGGSWFLNGWSLRSANRNRGRPDYRYDFLGFRLSLQTETVKTKGAGRTEAEPAQRATGVAPVPATVPVQPPKTGSTSPPILTTRPVEGKSFTIPNPKLDMLWCKPGTFIMGSPASERDREDDETGHKVTLTQGFWLGKHEVTQEQWQKVMRTNPSNFKGATLPVEIVSWSDAMQFCEKLTQMEKAAGRLPEGWAYTLPTEAQWEYACRAGTTTATSFGDSLSSRQANFNGDYPYGGAVKGPDLEKTTEVGTYPANPWGFHDMHGNVWEWCSDWYEDYPSGSASNPVGPSDGSKRVARGCSWIYFGRYLRSANRLRFTPDIRNYTLGFRLSLQTATAKTE